jgi:methylated-DNA-[protein]-cysteine S-methyltransferase
MSRSATASSTAGALNYWCMESPIGELLLLGESDRLCGLYMQHGDRPVVVSPEWRSSEVHFIDVRRQLDEYFAGARHTFDLDLKLHGTSFQRSVWSALVEIPYGETVSYGELARHLGNPAAVRAVGLANGRNPISVIVPCHRVIGADGSLTGYGGGLENKRHLLELESRAAQVTSQLTLSGLQ